jgi:hypothetical protein
MIVGGPNDILTGGGGQDLFIYRSLGDSGGTITDFNPTGDQHSVLDLRPLFDAIGYHGTNPIADKVLAFVPDGTTGTSVMIEPPGSSQAVNLVTLQHVVPTQIAAADYLWHG